MKPSQPDSTATDSAGRPVVPPRHARPGGAGNLARATALVALCIAATAPRLSADPVVIEGVEAERIAEANGWVVRAVTPDNRIVEIHRIIDGRPFYHVTHNANAADTVSTDECLPGGSSGLNLTGNGVELGIWDGGGVLISHDEFDGRVQLMDNPEYIEHHATHVAGTMIAAGVDPAAKGMAPAATLLSYDWDFDTTEMNSAAAAGMRVSNHSYGVITGWYYDGVYWFWWGDVTVDDYEEYRFGFYGSYAQEWDEVAYANPRYLTVMSAGNDRDEGPAPGTSHFYWAPGSGWSLSTAPRSLDGNDGYDSIGSQSVAKNGLTVGAVGDIIGGYGGPGTVDMTSFSCWGPCDDGRIKPDVVGNGEELYSSLAYAVDSYGTGSGTSMSSPNVAGSLGLLIEHFRATHSREDDMLSATLKALVIHTADEAGDDPGPDYRFGWGLVNTLSAAELITADTVESDLISEYTLGDGQVIEVPVFTLDGGGDLRVTIVWTDPPGVPPAPALDPTDKMLINDLDLRVIAGDGTEYEPWVLDPSDPAAAATRGDNDTDNVEQVVVPAPGDDELRIRVSHKGTLVGAPQAFAMVISGADHVYPDCNGNGVNDADDILAGTSTDCNDNGVPDECDLASGTSRDCNDNQIPDDCEFDDCNENCVPDEVDISDGTSGDCNTNGVPDECDLSSGSSADCNGNSRPDECEFTDCNGNCVPDGQDLDDGTSNDCNANDVPDECDAVAPGGADCNANLVPDECELDGNDCNANEVPDECDISSGTSGDCNASQVPDECELDGNDCNANSVPDECDLASGFSDDCNSTQVPDECELASNDCNSNTVPDECDLSSGTSEDCDSNQVPDECEFVDCNTNGELDACDILNCVDSPDCGDCNRNGTPDSCDIASGTSEDVNGNDVPDECECLTDEECDDGDLCNGTEFCNQFNACQDGDTLDCDDGNPCTDDTCDPATGCVNTPDETNSCDDGLYCNGAESCDAAGDCQAGDVPCAVDEVCAEDFDECVECLVDGDCADGLYCNGNESCDVDHTCQPGVGPCAADEVCDEDNDACVDCLVDAQCDDGSVCNGAETCDENGNCVPGTGLNCDDGNLCTDDACDPVTGCSHTVDDTNSCDDGLFCNGAETCVSGTCTAGAAVCPAGEFCDEVKNKCLECLEAADCDDGDACTADTCPDGRCEHTLFPDCADDDGDGVPNRDDKCPTGDDTKDADHDGVPDACDPCPKDAADDVDADHVCGDVDNCPTVANREQVDADGDGVGDACDPCPASADDDVDGDGLCGDVDNCPTIANELQADTDGDRIGDACDTCPLDAGNDRDEDGVCGDVDNCPLVANTLQTDADEDGIGDACDDDFVENPVPDVSGEGEVDGTLPSTRVCNVFGMTPLVFTFFGLVALRRRRRRT